MSDMIITRTYVISTTFVCPGPARIRGDETSEGPLDHLAEAITRKGGIHREAPDPKMFLVNQE